MKRVLLWGTAALCALAAALLIAAALGIWREGSARRAADPAAPIYTAEQVAERAKAPLVVLGAAALAAVVCAALGVRDESADKPARGRSLSKMASGTGTPAPGKLRAIRWSLLLLAAFCIAAGIWNGGVRDVLNKAINICTECVGLG